MDAAIKVVVTIMEILFFVGVAGSLVVVAWTTVEDVGLFSKDEKSAEYVTADPVHGEPSQISS